MITPIKNLYVLGALLVVLPLVGCDTTDASESDDSVVSGLKADLLSLEDHPYPVSWLISLFAYTPYETDAEEVVVFPFRGRSYYHPVYMVRVSLWELEAYRSDGDSTRLQRVQRFADAYMQKADRHEGLPYLPYQFDWAVGPSGRDTLQAPWYSGMAQGIMLSVLSRLYAHTADSHYLDHAEAVYQTLRVPDSGSRPAVSHVDESGYYWIDEYVTFPPEYILNGFIFAWFGLVDYHLATGRQQAASEIREALRTIKHYASRYRVPNGISYYSLRTLHQKENYHRAHVYQLRAIHELTGDDYFSVLADLFEADHAVD